MRDNVTLLKASVSAFAINSHTYSAEEEVSGIEVKALTCEILLRGAYVG